MRLLDAPFALQDTPGRCEWQAMRVKTDGVTAHLNFLKRRRTQIHDSPSMAPLHLSLQGGVHVGKRTEAGTCTWDPDTTPSTLHPLLRLLSAAVVWSHRRR